MSKRTITEIKDANGVLTGFELEDFHYILAPVDKAQKLNLIDKSEIFLTIDGKDTDVTVKEIFFHIHSIGGNIIRGNSILQIIDKDGTVDINNEKITVALYDKITGIHFTIQTVSNPFFKLDERNVTTENMTSYFKILTKGKVSPKDAVVEGEGESVEDKLKKAEEEKAAKEKAEQEAKEAEEARIKSEKEAADTKAKAEQEAKEEKEKAEKEAAEIKAKAEKEAKEAEEARIKSEKEAADTKAKAEQEAKEEKERIRAEAVASAKAELIAKQLGGQEYIDLLTEQEAEGYTEYEAVYGKNKYRFLFKDDSAPFFFVRLTVGDFIDLVDSIDDNNVEVEDETGIATYPFVDERQNRDLIFNPKEGTIKVEKSVAAKTA